eukprot:COSAG04_NODE_2302_length_4363_cov_4.173465_4_plen_401_part_00
MIMTDRWHWPVPGHEAGPSTLYGDYSREVGAGYRACPCTIDNSQWNSRCPEGPCGGGYNADTGGTIWIKRQFPYRYIGCFVDSARRDFRHCELCWDQGTGMSGEPADRLMECANRCSGYAYMGLQWNDECYCDNTYGDQGERDISFCDSDSSVGDYPDYADLAGVGNGASRRWANAVYELAHAQEVDEPTQRSTQMGRSGQSRRGAAANAAGKVMVGVVCAVFLLSSLLALVRHRVKEFRHRENIRDRRAMDARALPAPTTQNNPLASAVKPLQPIQPVGTAESRRTGNTDADGTAANAGPLRQVEALLSRSAAADGNLTFATGEIIDVLSDEPGEGWLTGTCGGRSGIFPANCKKSCCLDSVCGLVCSLCQCESVTCRCERAAGRARAGGRRMIVVYGF